MDTRHGAFFLHFFFLDVGDFIRSGSFFFSWYSHSVVRCFSIKFISRQCVLVVWEKLLFFCCLSLPLPLPLLLYIWCTRVFKRALMQRCVFCARFNIYFVDKFVNFSWLLKKREWLKTEISSLHTQKHSLYRSHIAQWFVHSSAVAVHIMPNLFHFFPLFFWLLLSICVSYLLSSFFVVSVGVFIKCSTISLKFIRSHFWMVSYARCGTIHWVNITFIKHTHTMSKYYSHTHTQQYSNK